MADRVSDLIPVVQRSYDLCAGLFRLSRAIFARRDVRNVGKRLLVRGLRAPSVATRGRARGKGIC